MGRGAFFLFFFLLCCCWRLFRAPALRVALRQRRELTAALDATSWRCVFCSAGCIFAYGQTGSGKTHSLLNAGSAGDSSQAGIVPRLVANLYVAIASDPGGVYTVECAMFQVYNEQVDDLLGEGHRQGKGLNLAVHNGGEVAGLSWHKCASPDALLKLFARGRNNIVYAETKMNKASSRSHAVMQLKVMRRPRTAGGAQQAGGAQKFQATLGKLSVVDLAGSERVKKSGVTGKGLKEAANINGSLLALGNVIQALASKKKHIPYRDSKLTRILQDSVGGNSKTTLLICLSPAMDSTSETISTLEFGSRAMSVELTATVNECQVVVDAEQLAADLAADGINAAMMAKQRELLDMQKSFADKERTRQKEMAALRVKADAEAKDRDKASSERESLISKWQAKAKEATAAAARKEKQMAVKLEAAEARVKEAAEGADAKKQLEGANKQLEGANKQLSTLRGVVEKLEAAAKEVEARRRAEVASAIQAATKAGGEEAASLAARLADAEGRLTEMADARDRAQASLQEARADAEGARADANASRKEVARLQSALEEAEEAAEARLAAQELSTRAVAAAAVAAAREEAEAAAEKTAAETLCALVAAKEAAAAELEVVEGRAEATAKSLWAKVEAAAAAGKAEAERLSAQMAADAVAAEEALKAAVAKAEAEGAAMVADREAQIVTLEARLEHAEAAHARAVAKMRDEADRREVALRADFEASTEVADRAARSAARLHSEEIAMTRAAAHSDLSAAESRAKASVRRMSAAFAAARALLGEERSEAVAAREALQRRFDARESRADDLRTIAEKERQVKHEQVRTRRALQEVAQLKMQLHNNAQVDAIFANGVTNKAQSRSAGSLRTTLQVRRQAATDAAMAQWGPEAAYANAPSAPRSRPSSAFVNTGRAAAGGRPASAHPLRDRLPYLQR